MNKTHIFKTTNNNRPGLKDVWNANMVENAIFSENDIPICPTTATEIPKKLISFDEAKTIHNKMIRQGQKTYHSKEYIHFYIDDSKFDGKQNSFWLYPEKALDIISHFDGMILPDPSTYSDFPDPLKRWNYYRMNAFGLWISSKGIPVISNVRWNTPDTWDYCFDGNPHNSMLSLGTVASNLRYKANYTLFESGLLYMVKKLSPHTLIVYGSSNYPCFETIKNMGVRIVTIPSKTYQYHERTKHHEQRT